LIYSHIKNLRPIFHWAQAAPTRYRDRSHCLSPSKFILVAAGSKGKGMGAADTLPPLWCRSRHVGLQRGS